MDFIPDSDQHHHQPLGESSMIHKTPVSHPRNNDSLVSQQQLQHTTQLRPWTRMEWGGIEEYYRKCDEELVERYRGSKEETYYLQVEESDGFDVKDFAIDRRAIGKIRPLDLTKDYLMTRALEFVGYAIKAYNNKYKGTDKLLEFDKVEKAMLQGAGGIQFYLTFVAYNPIKDKKKTYQALVTGPICNYEVVAFRSKPKEGVQGAPARPKKWEWDNRGCCVRKTKRRCRQDEEFQHGHYVMNKVCGGPLVLHAHRFVLAIMQWASHFLL